MLNPLKANSRVLRRASIRRLAKPSVSVISNPIRSAGSLSQRPNSGFVSFPGALKSSFTSSLKFETPDSYTALPTYRVVDQNGQVVDPSFNADISDEEVVKLYKDMLFISIMDLIMFDAQRQGRISFYMVSAGEEAVSVGTSSVLDREDPVFCQYREQGLFKERGFKTEQFMAQLFANKNDNGRGRNMPIHYGCKPLNIVSTLGIPPLQSSTNTFRHSTLSLHRWQHSFRRRRERLMP
jgi:2-oxoisovalerate dehydrogenase E1 component alpha subunit